MNIFDLTLLSWNPAPCRKMTTMRVILKYTRTDDFAGRNIVTTPCAGRSLVINRNRPISDPELFRWENETAYGTEQI